jgi:bromodomain adjacent to zinc finger domain protein 1A
LTGKTGLTYAEAAESEVKALKSLKSFPKCLENIIVYLITRTKRGNIKDLIEDLFSYTKDRFFIGEHVKLNVTQPGIKNDPNKTYEIIDVILPKENSENQIKDEKMETDENNQISSQPQQQIDPTLIKYVFDHNGTQRSFLANQISRIKNLLTKDKIYMLIKLNCEITDGVWTVLDKSVEKYDLNSFKFSKYFRGPLPQFQQTFGRGQFSKNNVLMSKMNDSKSNLNQSLNKSTNNNSKLNSSSSNKNQPSNNNIKTSKTSSNGAANNKSNNHSTNNTNSSKLNGKSNDLSNGKNVKSNHINAGLKVNDSTDDESSTVDKDIEEANAFASRIVQILEKKVCQLLNIS